MHLWKLLLVIFSSAVTPAMAGALEDGLAAFETKDYATALRLLRPLADQDDMVAQGLLGVMYHEGFGVPKDYASAAAWYRKSAEQGFAGAQFDLGLMYDNGQGVPQDYAEAATWYRKSAEQCNPFAQVNLGVMYAEGQGVPQDSVQAFLWFNLATASPISKDNHDEKENHERALKNREVVAAKMTAVQISEAQKLSPVCETTLAK